ncbi:hypothetical protein BOTBODRAFT_28881 [Botryobasidium botryosum FD-172 SS1]|uniref:Amidohydrolase-related domain-containing protein n=1 Tax=Botryobasidium botryosum (strain FD-172 SS1) TaxID=930990 RepID=A0A067MRY0_BOTB1|nr:hypothetical protein BOTBODRAFT_28881 [Botryobasidium botryosum FD-172 SS1]
MASPAIFVGTFVHCTRLNELQILKNYILATDEKGTITTFCPKDDPSVAALLSSSNGITKLTIPPGGFILPTFVDLHLHAPQYLYAGNGLHLPLMEWLDTYAFKAEERLDADPSLARRVYETLARRLVEAGTGATLLFGTIKEDTNLILAEAFQTVGLRGYVGKLSMDQSSRPTYVESSAQSSLQSARSFIDRCRSITVDLPDHERLVEPVLTPRFVPTCSDELLAGLGDISKTEGLRVQSHLAEAKDQVEWVRRERKQEDIDVFDKSGLLTSRTIQAHCTFLDKPSLARLESAGTSVAHCPLSNAYFSEEPFRLREALDKGVKVGLGTDIAGGYTVDIMSAMRQAVITSRMREGARLTAKQEGRSLTVGWKESLYMATKGGAEALGLLTGEFVVGAPFDAQQIELLAESKRGSLDFYDALEWAEDTIEKWWCLGDSRNRVGVWVQGKQILKK